MSECYYYRCLEAQCPPPASPWPTWSSLWSVSSSAALWEHCWLSASSDPGDFVCQYWSLSCDRHSQVDPELSLLPALLQANWSVPRVWGSSGGGQAQGWGQAVGGGGESQRPSQLPASAHQTGLGHIQEAGHEVRPGWPSAAGPVCCPAGDQTSVQPSSAACGRSEEQDHQSHQRRGAGQERHQAEQTVLQENSTVFVSSRGWTLRPQASEEVSGWEVRAEIQAEVRLLTLYYLIFTIKIF